MQHRWTMFAVWGLLAILQPGHTTAVAQTPSFDSPRLQVECSWLGNTFAGADAWIQQDIRALTVTSDGTVLTNVEWEEGGGNVGEYRDGRLVRYARHTHGWGAMGGVAIGANAKYVYLGGQFHNEGGHLQDEGTWPPKGKQWFGISRRERQDISRAAPFIVSSILKTLGCISGAPGLGCGASRANASCSSTT